LPNPKAVKGATSEHEGLIPADGVTGAKPGTFRRREMRTVLRLECVGGAAELGRVGHLRSLTFERRGLARRACCRPVVRMQRGLRARTWLLACARLGRAQSTGRRPARFQQPGHMRTPVRRTVDSQYTLGILKLLRAFSPLCRDRIVAAEGAQLGLPARLSHSCLHLPLLTQVGRRPGPVVASCRTRCGFERCSWPASRGRGPFGAPEQEPGDEALQQC